MKTSALSKITIIVILLSTFGMASCKHKEEKIPAMLERKAGANYEVDKVLVLSSYNDAKSAIEKNPNDIQQYINLAAAFIAEGRITGNSGYYNNAALEMLDNVTEGNKGNPDQVFQALTLKSSILLNYHQFKEALAVAEKAVTMNNFNSGIYGALIDANVEMGNYAKAVEYCDKMLTLRPDLRSYSRASYLRQIYGENSAAIQAMNMAVEAGVPGAENTEWARTTLGDLYLSNGNIDSATITYRTALVYRPGYPFALIGLAKAEKMKKEYAAAIAHTEEAIQCYSDASFILFLSELYKLQGNNKKATEIQNDVVALIEKGEKEEAENKHAKHNVHRELATAYMQAGKLDKALERAKKDLEMRPNNIDANTLIAWIYYMKGDNANAVESINKTFLTNIKNAELYYKAAVIYDRAGQKDKSAALMQQALAINPHIKNEFENGGVYAMAIKQ